MAGIGPATSPLPRECSTTEPHGQRHRIEDPNRAASAIRCRLDLTSPALERETGIEPASLAWKAKVLPLNYSRPGKQTLVEEAGFEPAYALAGRFTVCCL